MTLHMCERYWQISLSPSARELTASCAPYELYHFMVMPFKLHRAMAAFQRQLDYVIKDKEGFAAAFINEIII